MKTFLLLSLLLPFLSPGQNAGGSSEGSSVLVLGFKWSKSRQVVENLNADDPGPAAAMIPANKNFQRNARAQAPAGTRDPNEDTLDGRSAALEKSVRESRTPKTKPVDGFAFRVKVRNAGRAVAEVIFWEYQFKESANPANVARRQFLCGVNIKPDKETELRAFGASGPNDVVSAESLTGKSGKLFEEQVVINRMEYSDGTIWQRKDWDFAEVRLSIKRAVSTPWGTEMCRSL